MPKFNLYQMKNHQATIHTYKIDGHFDIKKILSLKNDKFSDAFSCRMAMGHEQRKGTLNSSGFRGKDDACVAT